MTTCYMHMKIQTLTDSLAISLATPLCHVIAYDNSNKIIIIMLQLCCSGAPCILNVYVCMHVY